MLSERTFDTGELTINYVEGPANGSPLVLLHGLTGWWHDFEPLFPYLTPEWHVYACDQRGHGKSGRAPAEDGYRVSDYARDIVSFIDGAVAGSEEIVLVGFSGGGLVALGVAAELPERVRGLILLDPAIMLRNSSIREYPSVSDRFAWAHYTRQAVQSVDEMFAKCQEMFPDVDERVLRVLAEKLMLVDPRATDLDAVDRSLDGLDLDEAAQRIRCPVLVLRGEQELGSIMRQEDADWVQASFPQGSVVQIREAGHPVHQDQMETVMRHVQAFLQSV